jgi:Gram-negative bacterial TonB protein C-terminal
MNMRLHSTALTFLVLACCNIQVGSLKPPCVVHLESPSYNNVARFARLQGDVTVAVTIDSDGRVSSATATGTSSSLLRDEAEKNIRTWIFEKGGSRLIEVHFIFRLVQPEVQNNPPAKVTFDLPERVTVVSNFAPKEPVR